MGRTKTGKKKIKPVLVVVVIVVVLICILAIGLNGENSSMMSTEEYFGTVSDIEAAVVVNGTVSETRGVVENGTYYVPFSAVEEGVKSGFYLDQTNGYMYLTREDVQSSWYSGDGTGNLIYKDGTFYVSTDCLKENTSVQININSDPNRISIVNENDGCDKATVNADINVHYRADMKSKVVCKAAKDTQVSVVEAVGDSWSYIYTEDGYGGYVHNSQIDVSDNNEKSDESREFTAITTEDTVKMVWHYIDSVDNNAYLTDMKEDTKNLNTICPTWFSISDTSGNINSYGTAEYVTKAHELGLNVWAMVGDYTGDGLTTGQILESTESRKNCVDQLIEQAVEYGVDGINVDFEIIKSDNVQAYLQFLRELTLEAHKNQLIISTDNYVPTYTKYYDRNEQAKIVDYMVVMAYDEHTVSSEEAGSVASLSFVKSGIEDTLDEVSASQVILGVPFYTRSWTEKVGSAALESEALSMEKGEEFAKEHDIELTWDETAGQYKGAAQDSSAVYSIWIEDENSIKEKLSLVKEYGLAGASGWRLGLEKSAVWDTWDSCLE